MKKWTVLAAYFIFVSSALVQAEEPKKTTFEVGPEIFTHIYSEPGFAREEGTLYGVVMNATSHDTWMTAIQIEIAEGKVDYYGGLMHSDGTTTPLKVYGITDYLVDARGLIGPEFNWDGGYGSPYTGIGYRWLRDESSKGGEGGYDRAANYIYLPVGLTATFALGNGWSLTPTAEYDWLLYGQQISEFSDIDPGFSDVTNQQRDGYGWRISLAVEKNFGSWGLKIQPFARSWRIKDSDRSEVLFNGAPVGSGLEPANKTQQFGLQALFTF
jgi:hypothetical protein